MKQTNEKNPAEEYFMRKNPKVDKVDQIDIRCKSPRCP